MLEPFIVGLAIGFILVQIMKRIDVWCKWCVFWCRTFYLTLKIAIKELIEELHAKD